MSLLPSKPDTSSAQDAEPRVIGVDSDDADDLIGALSSETARQLLAALHDEPAPPSELSRRVDTSLQNAQYHLEKLQAAGAVSVVDTAYSEKGREMDVYAPADQPLVIFAGEEERTTGLKAALSRLLGGVGLLAAGSLAIQALYGQSNQRVAPSGGGGDGGNGGGVAAPDGSAGGNGNGAGNGVSGGAAGDAGGVAQTTAEPAPTTAGDGFQINQVEPTPEATRTVEMTSSGRYTDAAVTSKDAAETVTTTTTEAVQTTAHNATDAVTTTAHNATDVATDATVNAGIPPGLLFFAGGALVLALWLAVWYARE